MQLFSFLERRRSTTNARSADTEVKVHNKPLEAPTRSSTLMRSASLLKTRLKGARTKGTSSQPSESGRPVSYDVKRDLTSSSESWRYSTSFVEFEESRPKRKSSLKGLLRRLRSSSREERFRTCNQEELAELAYLLELKETESVQSVTAKRNPRICQGDYRRSREVEIIYPYTMTTPWPIRGDKGLH